VKLGFFMQSYLADYNFGCAHFLRGLIRELLDLGHDAQVFCPADSWVAERSCALGGDAVLDEARALYPAVPTVSFEPGFAGLESHLATLDAVVVNEWIDDAIARRIGEHGAARGGPVTLYYDTHHRVVTAADELRAIRLDRYAMVLVLAESVAAAYKSRSLNARTEVFPEAVDDRRFSPARARAGTGPVVWIGNYGHDERGHALIASLTGLAGRHGLAVECHGVGYPPDAIDALTAAGVRVGGWLPNTRVPAVAAGARFMLHVPRGPYAAELAGVPNIRPYEAAGLAVPLVVISPAPLGFPFVPDVHYLGFADVDAFLDAVPELIARPARLEATAWRAHDLVMAGHTCRDRAHALLALVEGRR
jgi:hypothetical protein